MIWRVTGGILRRATERVDEGGDLETEWEGLSVGGVEEGAWEIGEGEVYCV